MPEEENRPGGLIPLGATHRHHTRDDDNLIQKKRN
jgi:hypothetical protein